MKRIKNFTLIIITLILLFSCFSPLIGPIKSYANTKTNSKTYIVLDSDSKNPLPNRFRTIDSLNISGSAQFTPSQLPNIKSKINNPKLSIIDLRQESHGFINDIAISFYSPQVTLNNGFTASQTLAAESKDLNSIPKNQEVTIYNKSTRPALKVFVESVRSEPMLVRYNTLSYIRLPVKDGSIPSPQIVDQFVALVKYQAVGSHYHFHCEAGEGRTTTFMAMYQIMHNKDSLSLKDILDYQVSIGGVVLTDNANRREFLEEFYTYVKYNKLTNFKVPYSQWVQHSKIN